MWRSVQAIKYTITKLWFMGHTEELCKLEFLEPVVEIVPSFFTGNQFMQFHTHTYIVLEDY